MADEAWVDIGSTEELSRSPLQHVTAGNRELAVSYMLAARSGMAGSMAITSPAPGTTGNSIAAAERASPDSRRTPSPPIP